jgi:hypothetical protein
LYSSSSGGITALNHAVDNSMTKRELVEYANSHNIEIDEKANKSIIINKINETE